MLIKKLVRKSVVVIGLAAISALVAADCASDCQQEYDECMKHSQSTGKAKICGEILRDCKLKCASDG
jgi:hypothetical protein